MNPRKSVRHISDDISLTETKHYIFYSRLVKKHYKIFIAEPEKEYSQKPYPVVYALDANTTFLMTVQMIRLLQYTNELPPMLIVGIGYQDESFDSVVDHRVQEFTPTSDLEYKHIWHSRFSCSSDGGDAALFMRFLQEELKPFIEATYPVDPNDATLVGDSLGGLFALYTLLQKPKAFERYVIGSPAIFWDRGVLWEYEKQYADQHRNLNAQVFMAVGGLEDSEPYHFPADTRESTKHIRLVDDMKRMATTLEGRDYPDLKLHSHVFEGETHMSVIAPCINRGLRVLFRPTP